MATSVWVIRPDLRLHQPEYFLEERHGVIRPARGLVGSGEIVHGGESAGVIGPETTLAAIEHFLEETDRFG